LGLETRIRHECNDPSDVGEFTEIKKEAVSQLETVFFYVFSCIKELQFVYLYLIYR